MAWSTEYQDTPMKYLFSVLFLSLMLCGATGLAAESAEPWRADPGSPLVDVHSPDYVHYASAYYARYHALDDASIPGLDNFREELDSNGHPKWFDGVQGKYTLTQLVERLIAHEQFDDLDRLFDDWSDPKSRMADGRWKLSSFVDAVTERFVVTKAWDSNYLVLQNWKKKNPKSIAANLSEVIYWINYAWDARGNGYADSISPLGRKLFEERLLKAEQTLLNCKDSSSQNPVWYSEYIRVANGLNWPKADIYKLVMDAEQKQKYFYGLYMRYAVALTPKWGGSWELVDAFIKASTDNTKDQEGHSLYARLYWTVDEHTPEFNLFRDTQASWPEMKKGFDDLMRRYPHSAWNLNNYAAYACKAGDKSTFQYLRFLIGNNVTPQAWNSSYSLDLCEHNFPDQAL